MSESMNGFAKGLLIGTMVGATVVLLTAPLAGKDLRREIRRKAGDARQGLGTYLRRLRGRLVTEADQPVDEPIMDPRGSGSKARHGREEKRLEETDGA